ncbi:MAG: M1 family aminopeptidase [Candidatus Zixiibacteriota bacterium]
MIAGRLRILLTLTILLFLTFDIPLSQPSESAGDWSSATPAQLHQQMWEAKSRALLNKQYAEQAVQAVPASTQTNYDVKFHDIYIRVNDTTEILYGRVKFVAEAAQNGVSQVEVDLYSNMVIDSIVAPTGQLAYTRLGNVVTVTLDQTYNTGQQFEFDFYYQGHPIEGGFQAFSFDINIYGSKVISSLSEPYFARTWWPCKDRPDDKVDSYKIAIEVDSGFYCGSNGSLDSTIATSANTKTYYYSVHYPMVTYLFSVAISRYTVWHDWYRYNGNQDSMLLTHAVYPAQYTYSLPRYGITPQAISLLSQTFGPYPFLTEKYGHSNFEWGGGMEHQTMTSMTGSSFGFSEPVVVHELTHQWWGDMITCKSWGHIWLNEGFASYGEAVYYLNRDGWSAYHTYMNGMAYSGGGTIYISDTSSVNNIFGSIVYDKGAWVVHMLRGILGEAEFADAMTAWYNSPYQHGSATTEEFRDVVEAATGVNIHNFIQDWIYGTLRPTYQYQWYSEARIGGGYYVYIFVKQTQTSNPQVFRMPVDFAVDHAAASSDTVVADINQRQQLFKYIVANSVTNVSLDPAGWVLKNAGMASWTLHIVTLDSELTDGLQYTAYNDTVLARGGSANRSFVIASGSIPSGITFSSTGILSGTTADSGNFTFLVRVTDNNSGASDSSQFTIRIEPRVLVPGDVNMDGTTDISDLQMMIDYLFFSGPAPVVIDLADMDASCAVDIADLTLLVDYLFFSGPPPVIGCVP